MPDPQAETAEICGERPSLHGEPQKHDYRDGVCFWCAAPECGLLVKIREWTDGEDDGEWPAPPEYVEYRVEGQMRSDVLVRLGRPADDPCEVRLIHGVIEGGYSEYTVEHDYPIEVWIHEGRQSQKVFDAWGWSKESGVAALLRWLISSSGREGDLS